jgi:hypothetical protein
MDINDVNREEVDF